MGLLNKERKGNRCKLNPDGGETCERVIQDNKGEILGTQQKGTISADPSDGCKPRLTGDSTIFDDDKSSFNDAAGRVSDRCKSRVNSQQQEGGQSE